MKPKHLIIFSYFICCISCSFSKQKECVEDISMNPNEMKVIEAPDSATLMTLSLEDAVSKYGEPKVLERFNTKTDFLSEFRIELLNYYSKDEIEKGVIIEELTWEKDSLFNVTVWYEVKIAENIPMHILIWIKQSEF